jgi:hypothetical protein
MLPKNVMLAKGRIRRLAIPLKLVSRSLPALVPAFCLKGIALALLAMVSLFSVSGWAQVFDLQTDEVQVHAEIQAGWNVYWGPVFSETDYLRLIEALVTSINDGEATPLKDFFENQIDNVLDVMDQAIPTLKRDALRDLVLGAFFGKDDSPIYAGGFEISAGVARYEQWKRFIYDEPRTYECQICTPSWFCSDCCITSICTTLEQKEFKVPFFPRFQPYIRYRPSGSDSTTTDTRLGTFVLDFAESNRADVQRNIKSDGWHVVWGVNLNEIEYLKFANAAAQGIFTGGATLVVYFQEYLTKTILRISCLIVRTLRSWVIQQRGVCSVRKEVAMRQQAVKQACEQHSMDVALAALRQSIARWTDKEGLLMTAIPGVSLARRDAPTQPTSALYEPSICVIAKGSNACGSATTRMCSTRTIF